MSIKENISIVDNFAYAVNDEMQVKETRVGDVSCLVIDDYFADPDYVKETFLKFPFDIGQCTLETAVKEIQDGGDNPGFIKPMGENQVIHPHLVQTLTMGYHDLLKEYSYIPEMSHQEDTEASFNKAMNSSLHTGCLFYPDMNITANKHKPSPGNYYMNAVAFLSEDSVGVDNGISFYTFQYENAYFHGVKELIDDTTDAELRRDIMDLLNYKYIPQKAFEKFSIFDGDEYFVRLFTVEAKYNRVVLFPGNSWFQHNYDNKSEKYFIESCLDVPEAQTEQSAESMMGGPQFEEFEEPPMEFITYE
jgi:hypothetical protein